MLLAKEDNLPTDYLHRNIPDNSKSSSYMPPIKSSSKHYLSPSQFQSVKRLPPFSYQQTPKKEYNQVKLEPFHPPYSGMLDKNSESTAKMTLDKFKALSASIKPKNNIRAPYKSYKNNDYSDPENSPEPREHANSNENARSNKHSDPLTTFQTFMSRLNKLQINSVLPNFEPIRFSDKSHGIVKGFAVCTNQGLVRNYNEDRVSVILNISRPVNKPSNEYWPNCSIFGVFDGHGGFKCAEFLRNNLHQFIIKNKNFPWNPQEALKEAFEEADKTFLENVLIESEDGIYDKSGSCALVVMIMDDTCYVCNVGDSRAIISQNFGNSCFALSRDHKPSDKLEQKRILEAGGKVYQNFPTSITGKRIDLDPRTNPLALQVPFRILPGRLSVSRAFGDIEAKMARFGGNPNVLIAKPEITTLKINKEHDFIFLASDGVFDKLLNEEVSGVAWKKWKDKRDQNIHGALKNGVETIIKESMLKKSLDNVTGILIGFSHLENFIGGHEPERREINPLDQLEDMKHSQLNQLRDHRESPSSSHNQTPVKVSMKALNTNGLNNMGDSVDLNKGRVTSRGNVYNQKANDPFDFSKYMESNMRRGSESLPKLNQFKANKGF